MKFFLIVIALLCVSCSSFKSQESNLAQSSQAKVSEDRVSVEKVKNLVAGYSWNAALSQWNRSLELSNCKENQCKLQVIFSTPQTCPVEAKEDEWCDEIELSGKVQFVANGFNFIDDANEASGFCELKNDGAPDSWILDGATCPWNLKQLRHGHKIN